MLFSIVIPTYNRADRITDTVQSVLQQSYTNLEVIVVDDGSTDNTGEVMARIADARVRYFKKENAERAAARNYGTKQAKGHYITFLDSDDLLYPNHLEAAAELIREKGEVGFFHLGYEIKDPETGKISPGDFRRPADALILGNFLSCMGVFMRRDVALKHLFDETRELSTSEDWELWLRVACDETLYSSYKITSVVIDHSGRSVLNYKTDVLIRNKELLIDTVTKNPSIQKKYAGKLRRFKSSNYSYIALHIALTKKNKALAWRYLFKSLKESPQSLFQRRFLAIIKHLVF